MVLCTLGVGCVSVRVCSCVSLCVIGCFEGWSDVMDVSGETDLKVVNWKLRQCWDDVIDFHTLSEQYAEVCAIARNGWRGEEGTTVGSKEDLENGTREKEEQRGGERRREGDHEVKVGSKVRLKDGHYGTFKCLEKSCFMYVTSITLNLWLS